MLKPAQQASAVDIVKLTRGQNLGSVMRKAGCHPGWLADIIADSNLGDLRKLRIGQEIVLPENCSNSPAERMVQLSAVIRLTDAARNKLRVRSESLVSKETQNRLSEMEKQIADLKNELSETKAALDATQKEASSAQKAREVAEIKLVATEKTAEKAQLAQKTAEAKFASSDGKEFFSFSFLVWLIASFLLGLVGASIINSFRLRNKVLIDKSVEVWKVGKKYVFPLSPFYEINSAGLEPDYACPLCSEKRIMAKNCGRHLEKEHYAQIHIEDL